MATDVVSAAPAGVGSQAQLATGSFTSAGNAVSLVCGFNPRYVELVNVTDNTTWEKMQGMAPANSIKNVAGTMTQDATSAVTFPADAGLNEPGSSVLISAIAAGTGKVWAWSVWG